MCERERECAAFVSLSQPAGPLSCSGSGNGSSRHSSVRRPTLSAATLTDDGGAGWAVGRTKVGLWQVSRERDAGGGVRGTWVALRSLSNTGAHSAQQPGGDNSAGEMDQLSFGQRATGKKVGFGRLALCGWTAQRADRKMRRRSNQTKRMNDISLKSCHTVVWKM